MYAEFLAIVILAGVMMMALFRRYWVGVLAAAAGLYVTTGIVATMLRAEWPLVSEWLRADARVVLAMMTIVPATLWGVERARVARASDAREVVDLFALVALVNAAILLWVVVMS